MLIPLHDPTVILCTALMNPCMLHLLLLYIKLRPCIVVCILYSIFQLTGMAALVPQFAYFICLLAVGCTALDVNSFIPFGTANGDTVFFSNDDATTNVTVPVRFPFYDRLFTIIYVSQIGVAIFSILVTLLIVALFLSTFSLWCSDQQQWPTLL